MRIFYRFFFFVFLIIGFSLEGITQNKAKDEHIRLYIEQFKQIAIEQMMVYGVPASITLAQGILESYSGKSDLARYANNHFGIKCKPEWKGESFAKYENGKYEYYRKYSSTEESFLDHTQFILSRPRYFFLFDFSPTDYVSWAKGLKKAGYATDPNYHNLLISLIKRYKLYLFDKIAITQLASE
jgi:flagellum-specific peptidoglycan hydrolase FlgJ